MEKPKREVEDEDYKKYRQDKFWSRVVNGAVIIILLAVFFLFLMNRNDYSSYPSDCYQGRSGMICN